jgi:hypothetical protein
MEIGELVAIGFLASDLNAKCPFTEEDKGPSEVEEENIGKDDRDSAAKEQENDGGVLGKNLTSGSPGEAGTIGGPYTAEPRAPEPANDTKRSEGKLRALVPGTDAVDTSEYPFLQAAHHLIPGNASLEPSELKRFMTQGSSVNTVTGRSFTLNSHIGYNVNGSHNGVWLAGNYAVRASGKWKKTPVPGATWGALDALHSDWQMNYVAAVAKASGAQFHDTHTDYSDAVKALLNAIATVLFAHQAACEQCKSKTEIPPPFLIKERLYNISAYLKTKVRGGPLAWGRPWMTSDRWRDAAFSGGRISDSFVDAFEKAKRLED